MLSKTTCSNKPLQEITFCECYILSSYPLLQAVLHFFQFGNISQYLESKTNLTKKEPDLPSFTVFPWNGRFRLESQSHVQTKIVMMNLHLRQFSSFVLAEGYFCCVFWNKDNPSESLILSRIQIEKSQINAWFTLTSLSDIGCLFYSLISQGRRKALLASNLFYLG